MPSDVPPDIPVAAVGRYAKFSEAQERGLVVIAQDHAFWIVREGDEFVLYVEPEAQAEIAAELEKFEAEQVQRANELARAAEPLPKIETMSLFVAVWVMSMFWLAQNVASPELIARGEADSARIIHDGEWWRALTALTLHGDLSHLVANVATGLLFAAFVLPQFGTGMTWLGIVLTGLLGNLANAWFFRGEAHISIGASTSVFGALGLLMTAEFIDRWRHHSDRTLWQLTVPIGAGVALLAFLGAGDEQHTRVDYMAHLFGFCAGAMVGAVFALARLGEQAPRWMQRLAALAAPLALAAAWWRTFPTASP